MIYPLTICFDRYSGVYSGGAYTAWNCDSDDVPTEISNDDVTCANFWRRAKARHKSNDDFIPEFGVGSTVEEAVADLRKKLIAVKEDFSVDESFKTYEEATRKPDIFCEENLDMVPVAKVREALGIAEDSDIFQCIKYRNHQLEDIKTLRMELEMSKKSDERAHSEMYKARGEKYELEKKVRDILGINPEAEFFEALRYARGDMDATFRLRAESSELRHRNNELCRRLVDIRHAAGMEDNDPCDLVKFITLLRKDKELNDDEKFQRRKLGQQLRRIREAAGMDDRDLTSIEDYVKGLRKAEKYKRLYEELKSDIKFLSEDIQSALEWSDSEEMKEEK